MKSNKIILITSLITVAVLIFISVLTFGIITLSAPNRMASFCYEIGLEKLSQKLYYKDYKKTDSINSLYSALSINIELKNSENIVYMFNELSSLNNYNKFVDEYNENVLQSGNSKLLKSTLYNLDNYLKEKYVDAKLNLKNQHLNVFEYASRELFMANHNLSFNKQGAYLFSSLFKDEVLSIMAPMIKGEVDGKIVFDEIISYFNNLNQYLELNKNNTEDDVLKIAFANRIIKVGNDILTLCEYSEDFIADISGINNKIINLKNTYISGLING